MAVEHIVVQLNGAVAAYLAALRTALEEVTGLKLHSRYFHGGAVHRCGSYGFTTLDEKVELVKDADFQAAEDLVFENYLDRVDAAKGAVKALGTLATQGARISAVSTIGMSRVERSLEGTPLIGEFLEKHGLSRIIQPVASANTDKVEAAFRSADVVIDHDLRRLQNALGYSKEARGVLWSPAPGCVGCEAVPFHYDERIKNVRGWDAFPKNLRELF